MSIDFTEEMFDYYAEMHNDFLEIHSDGFVISSLTHIVNRVSSEFTIDSRILDVGVGNGIWSIEIAKHCDHVVGIDISQKMIDRANINFDKMKMADKITLFKMNANRISDLGMNQFDAIFAIGDVLNYCDDYTSVLKQIHFVSKDKGMVVISVISKSGLLKRLIVNGAPENEIYRLIDSSKWREHQAADAQKNLDITTYLPEDLVSTMKEIGFSNIEIIPLGIIPSIMNISDDPSILEGKTPHSKQYYFELEKQLAANKLFCCDSLEFCLIGQKN